MHILIISGWSRFGMRQSLYLVAGHKYCIMINFIKIFLKYQLKIGWFAMLRGNFY